MQDLQHLKRKREQELEEEKIGLEEECKRFRSQYSYPGMWGKWATGQGAVVKEEKVPRVHGEEGLVYPTAYPTAPSQETKAIYGSSIQETGLYDAMSQAYPALQSSLGKINFDVHDDDGDDYSIIFLVKVKDLNSS